MSVALFLKYLREHGPCTSREIAENIGLHHKHAAAVQFVVLQESPRHGQRAHVIRWEFDTPGARRYPRAVLAIGPGRNVPRPPVDYAERSKREYARRRDRSVRSVWDLGKTIQARLERRAGA